MTLLKDTEVEELLTHSRPLIRGFESDRLGTPSSPIKGTSLDLTVGKIYVPGVGINSLGSPYKPRKELTLLQGHTAVICTAEYLQFPDNIAGIAFPPSTKVSLAGLLTTNPGHVDPGYNGPLHLTVINMGREPFHLERGARIMRLLLFRLSDNVKKSARRSYVPPLVDEELLDKLSADFLSVDERATTAAKDAVMKAEMRARWWQVAVPLLVAIVTALGSTLLTLWTFQNGMEERLAKMEGQLNPPASSEVVQNLEGRLSKIERQLRRDRASEKP